MKLKDNKILITGGGSGIGLGLTERFVKEGNQVIICGRRNDVLKSITKRFPSVITKTCDLSLEDQRIELFEWIQSEHGDLNALVNNAGIQNWMNISDADFYERSKKEIEINALAPLHLTTLFLKLKSLDTLINVTSALSFVPLTKTPTYCSTKAFFHSFTVSLRHLLRTQNIEVIEIIPPGLNTDLGGEGLHDDFPSVADFIESIFDQLQMGKKELTFSYSEQLSQGTNELTKDLFDKMNS